MGRFGSVSPALNVEDAVWVGDFNVHMLLPSLSFSFWPTVPWALLACSAALLWRLPLGRAVVGIHGLIWCEMACPPRTAYTAHCGCSESPSAFLRPLRGEVLSTGELTSAPPAHLSTS